MDVFHNISEVDLRSSGRQTVVAFGSFDGLHQGHRMLLSRVLEISEADNLIPAVLTFENHPLSVLAPPYCPELLMSPRRKLDVLEQLGMRLVVMPPFTRELSLMPAKQFLREVLLERMQMRHIICGYDCRFGHKGLGDGQMLKSEGKRLGFGVEIFEARRSDGVVIGSSVIRELLALGQVDKAVDLLERPHELRGVVIHGEERGRTLGYPTANLKFEDNYLVPANGVYAIWADVENKRYGGMINLGVRPTFGQPKFLPEAHLFEFNEMIYDETIDIYFLSKLRDERKFQSPADLMVQLEKDKKDAQAVLLNF